MSTCQNMVMKRVAIEGNRNLLQGAALVLLALISSSKGDSSFVPANSVPKGTISVRCYTIPCRSAVDVAIQCDRLSTCWGLTDAVYPGHNCSMCTCPAEAAMLNDVGIAHFKEIQITPFHKCKDFCVLYWMILCPVSCKKLTKEHALHIHVLSATTSCPE